MRKSSVAEKSAAAPTFADTFHERHRRLEMLTATIILAALKGGAHAITKLQVTEQILELHSVKPILENLKPYRVNNWLSTIARMDAFHDYGIELRTGTGFTFAVPIEELPPEGGNVYNIAIARAKAQRRAVSVAKLDKEQADFEKELAALTKAAGI